MDNNKYLTKIAELFSDETKQVARTFTEATLMGIPSHFAGGYIGSSIGRKFGKPGLGATVGTMIGGGATDLLALVRAAKRQSKKRESKLL